MKGFPGGSGPTNMSTYDSISVYTTLRAGYVSAANFELCDKTSGLVSGTLGNGTYYSI